MKLCSLVRAVTLVLIALFVVAPASRSRASGQLTAVLQSEVRITDPHFAAAAITRNFGYLVYDTLFALDSAGTVQPQMAQSYRVSPDGLEWTVTLREGLLWHDGQPVTASDCVASIRRWGSRDALGRQLMAATAGIEGLDGRSFVIRLHEPFGLVIDALAKPGSFVPFMLPERMASRPATEQIADVVGSGPFVFERGRWTPGASMHFLRNTAYRPRSEPADYLAGGKQVRLDSVELRVIPDGGTAVAALQTGEVDFLEMPPLDLLPTLQRDRNIRVVPLTGANMWMGFFRLNHATPPFDDPEIRRVLWRAVEQAAVPQAMGAIGDLSLSSCHSFWMCGTPLASDAGADIAANPSIESARAALRATRYAGQPVVILQAMDVDAARMSSEIFADVLRRTGFTVDLQPMDWGSLLTRRVRRDGWSVYGIHAQGFDLASPLTHYFVGSNCADYPGWHCDARLTTLLRDFVRADSVVARRAIADDIQRIAYDITPAVIWGQFSQPIAYRAALRGLIPSGIPVFWNVDK